MAPRYSNEELAKMLLIYGECHQNERKAAALYAIRYPDKRHPSPSLFDSLYRRLCQSGTLHESTRPRNIRQRDEQMIDQVREAVSANPHTSIRCIARDLNITPTRVYRVIKKNLKLHPYKQHTTQKLFPQDLPRRERFCDWISDQVDIDNVEHDNFLRRILWTDECTFRSDGRINRYNEHHYAEQNPHCRKETHIQGHYSVNVWMGIVDNVVIGPHFFAENVNITAEVYADFLENTLPNLLANEQLNIPQNEVIFQQVGHPAHTALLTRRVLNRRFPQRWIGIHSDLHEWPPRSSDLTPMDFFAWEYIRDQVYQTLPRTREDLINKITAASRNITPAMLNNVRQSFMRRVALCLEDAGGYFEHLL